MDKSGENRKKSYVEVLREAAAKYGVKVTDMSERGIVGIGIVGGVTGKLPRSQAPKPKNNAPATTLGE